MRYNIRFLGGSTCWPMVQVIALCVVARVEVSVWRGVHCAFSCARLHMGATHHVNPHCPLGKLSAEPCFRLVERIHSGLSKSKIKELDWIGRCACQDEQKAAKVGLRMSVDASVFTNMAEHSQLLNSVWGKATAGDLVKDQKIISIPAEASVEDACEVGPFS